MGLPTISGTATQGETLTADTSGITDADGFFTPPNFLYQWKADGADISGGLAATFILTQSQVGKAITVTVSYTDRGRNDESLTSAATSAVVNANDAPTITGIPLGIVAEDSAYSFTPTGADVDAGTTLTYSIENKPSWADFNAATGALTGTPGNDDDFFTVGIVITVSDGTLTASLPAFNLVVTPVNDAPTITGTPATTVAEGNAYSFTPIGADVDDGATLAYSITNKPGWADFSTTTGALTGTPTNADVGSTTLGIVITLTSGSDTVSLPAFNLTVEAAAVADTTPPTITLLGSATLSIALNTAYTDAGATASDNTDGDITASITTTITFNNGAVAAVNTNTAGVYSIAYNVSDTAGNQATPVTRTVTVMPAVTDTTPPTITLLGSATLSIALNTAYTDAGATASDNTDGNITASITTTITFNNGAVAAVNTNTAGVYSIAYNVSDTAGNQATPVTRTVTVMPAVTDTTPPTITLLGSATLSIALNTAYTDAGATASDNTDGNITASITTTITSNGNTVSAVNTNTAGVYSIAYNVSDTAGNQATPVTRTVTVMPAVTVPSISISTATVTATVGTAIADITITSSGGTVASYGIAPTLPDGLTLDTSNGTISGTPTAVAEAISYIITATNSGGTATATVAITVNAAPVAVAAPSISISPATVTATAGTAIADITIDSTTGGGGTVASYSIAPAIGNGLLFDATTGTISGTPTAVAEAISYTITATNSGGEAMVTLTITVNAAAVAVPIISISATTVTATVGSAIADITIDSTTGGGGAVASYGIAPDIGNGLLFDANTGTISGTPTAVAEAITYTITATNSGGEAMVTLTITVNAAADTTLPAAPLISTTAQTVNTVAFTLSGTADAGASIQLLRSGTAITSATTDADTNGNWSITFDLMEGENLITATASDSADNTSVPSAAVSITLDTVAPTVTFTNPTQLVRTAAFTLTGTTEAGATVNVRKDGTSIGAANVTATTWSLATTLTEGLNVFAVIATDAAGNTSTATITITLNTLLADAPVIRVINTVLNNANDHGIICITFDADVVFDRSPDAAFLNERLGDFTLSSDASSSPALTVIDFTSCFVDGEAPRDAIQLTLNRQIAHGETATLSYTKTGTEHNTKGIRRDLTGGSEPLADFSDKPITNNAIAPIEGLELVSAGTSSANRILLSFGLEIVTTTTSPDPRAADFTVSGAASSPTVTGISQATPSALLLTLSANIVGGETITLSYAKTTGSISGASAGELVSFDDYSVTNTRPAPAPAPVTAPSISISQAIVTATAGTAIAPITIASTGGAVASYSIEPALPAGLTLDATTGTISGTPTAVAEAISYIITATNSAGTNDATVAITVNADPAPVITPPARERLPKPVITTSPTLPVSTAMFTVAGTAEPGVKITILQDDPECDNSNSPTGTGTVVSDAEGDWTIDITLCEGVNNIQAVASIPGENPDKDPSALSEAIVITLDTTDPAPVITPPVQSAVPAITTASAATVSTAMFTVTGTAEPGVKIQILRDGSECASTPRLSGSGVSDASGDWTIDISLCDGVNNIQAVATMAGKAPSALSEAIVITLDTTDPAPVITPPARERLPKPVITTSPTLPVSTAMFTVAGTAEPGVKITILQDDPECDNSNSPTGTGTVVSDAEGDWTIDITLCEGVNNIQAVASIPGENPDKDPSALSEAIVITLDTTDPAPVITPPVQSAVPAITTASAATVSTAMFTVTGTAEPGVKIQILRDGSECASTPRLSGSGVSDASGDWTIDISLCDGVNNIQAVATMAGKAPSALSEAIVITLDTTDPAPVITPPARERLPKPVITTSPTLPVSTAMFTVAGTAEPGVKITILQDDPECDNSNSPTGTGTVVSDAEGDWTIDITLCEGVNNIQAVASIPGENPDKDPSALSEAIVITLDTTDPAPVITPPVQSAVPAITTASAATVSTAMFTVTGTAEPGVKIQILRDGSECASTPRLSGSGVSDASGDWTIDISLCDGVNNIQAVATMAGKAPSALSEAIVITLDTTDPAPVITPPARERLPKPVITTSPTLPVSTAMFTVAGTAEPGVKITILQDDPECDNSNSPTGTGTVVSDAEGDWTIDITLCEGVNNIQAVASIPGENPDKDPSALSEAIVITLDTTDPAPVITPPVQSAVPAITTASAATVSTAMFTVTGTAEPGVKIQILRDGSECASTPRLSGSGVSDASGDWTIDISLCDGVNNIQAVATMAGKAPSALSEAIVITLDTTDPAPVITPPARERLPKPVITTSPTLPVSTAMFTVAGTAEPGVKITILQDDPECDNSNSPTGTGTVVSDAEGDWTIDITLCEGVNNIQAVASIPGENPDKDPSALSEAIVITLDTTDPAPVITPPVQSAVPAITTASAATVSTAMFTVTGTAEPGVKIQILRDGSECASTPRLSGSGVSDASGDWTIDISLCDGVNNIQAVATMAGKAPSALSEAIVITLDTTDPAPVITPPARERLPKPVITTSPTLPVSTAMFTVAGTAEPGVKITILQDDPECDNSNSPTGTGTVVSDAEGDWTIDITLCEGVNNIQAVASIPGENPDKDPSALSEAIVITLDTTDPAPVITPPVQSAVPAITTASAATVSTAMFTVTGTAEPGVKIQILRDGSECASTPRLSGSGVSDASGDWTIDISLCDGVNNIQAVATMAGKAPSALSEAIVITLDTTDPAPVITLNGANPQTIEQGAGYTELGASTNDGFMVSIDDAAFVDAVGTYTITYTATDGTNQVTPVTRTVNVVDTTAPTITLTGDNPQTIEQGAGYTELGATTDDGSTVSIDSSTFTDAVGTYTITYTATDGTNQATPVTRTVNVVDTTAPTVTISTTTPQTVNTASFALAGATEAGASIQLFSSGNSITGATIASAATNGGWRIDVILEEGVNRITATATDAAGNTSAATDAVSITLDTTAPTVTISTTSQTVNTAAFTLKGTTETGATVDVLKDGTSIGAASVTGTSWSKTLTLTNGANTFTATASDSLGNTSDATDAVSITLDTAPSFGTAAIPHQTYTAGTAIPALTLPAASGGNGALTYSLTPSLPRGLTFDTASRTISGTADAETASTSYTYIAADSDTNTAATDTARLTFSITVLADGLSEEDIQQLNLAIMPRLTQALVASSAASVERRVDSAFASAETAASYQLDGHQIQFDSQTTLTEKLTGGLLQKLAGYGRSHRDGNINWKQMLSNSSFLIPLHSADQAGANQASAANSGLVVWGSGDYSRLSENDPGLDWQGDLTSLQLGLDKRLDSLLLGGMVTWSEGDVDYTLEGDKGTYNHKMTSIHPYLAWNNARADLWGSLGYGQGDLTIKHQKNAQEDNTHSTDTNLLSLAAGIKGQLISGLSLKSDLLLARTDINAAADVNIAKQTIDSQRLRLLLEIAGQYTLASGSTIKPVLEIGARYDGGDGNSGTGAVLGAGMRYANLAGLTLEGNLHALVGQGNYKEWGIQALISLDPGTDQLGLAFSLRPGYGYNGSSSDTSALWQQNLSQSNLHNSATDYSATDYGARLGANLSYGLLAPGQVGLLTPYSEITLGAINSYRLGIRWQGASRFDLHLFGEHRESSGHLEGSRGTDQAIQLEGTVHF